jgi:hypothetical protein
MDPNHISFEDKPTFSNKNWIDVFAWSVDKKKQIRRRNLIYVVTGRSVSQELTDAKAD